MKIKNLQIVSTDFSIPFSVAPSNILRNLHRTLPKIQSLPHIEPFPIEPPNSHQNSLISDKIYRTIPKAF